jgi:two-component system cell cycle sensor histidine kinase/response regulator CckA
MSDSDTAKERDLLHRQADRMEAVGMLARGIAHDFNNMLSGVLGFTSYLRSKAVPGSDLHRDLGLIAQSGQQAVTLTQKLFLIARRRHGARAPVDVLGVVAEALKGVAQDKLAAAELRVEPLGELVPCWGDAQHLRIAIQNLLQRAVENLPEQGGRLEITVAARALTSDEEAMLVNTGSPMYVCLAITDNGRSMSDEMRMHLFDPFYLSRTSWEGPGLDMAVAYGVIANHLGNVHVARRPEGGTEIRVYLPVHEEAVKDRVPEERLLAGTETVLVVDDESMIREMVAWILEAKGYHVLMACSGEEAVDIYRQEAARVDLIVLDLVMPGMGGEEAFFALREQNRKAAVLLSSVRTHEDLAESLVKQGAFGVVYKPYRTDTLLAAVRKALNAAKNMA